MKTRVRQKSAPKRAQRLRLERPALPKRQRPRRKPRKRKPKKRRQQRKHREHARPLSANGKLAAARTGERLQDRRLNPKPRARQTRSVELSVYLQDDVVRIGHEVKQVPPAYAIPFRQDQKNDFRGAHAVAETVERPSTRCVHSLADLFCERLSNPWTPLAGLSRLR